MLVGAVVLGPNLNIKRLNFVLNYWCLKISTWSVFHHALIETVWIENNMYNIVENLSGTDFGLDCWNGLAVGFPEDEQDCSYFYFFGGKGRDKLQFLVLFPRWITLHNIIQIGTFRTYYKVQTYFLPYSYSIRSLPIIVPYYAFSSSSSSFFPSSFSPSFSQPEPL